MMTVKPLEWVTENKRLDARTFFGTYSIFNTGSYFHLRLHPGLEEPTHVGEAYHSQTFEEAKEKAQADYERRILSALEPTEITLDELAAAERIESVSFSPSQNETGKLTVYHPASALTYTSGDDEAPVEAELLDAPFVFGLEAQGHIPTVERLLAEGQDWKHIGDVIGWDGETAKQYYQRHLDRKAAAARPQSAAVRDGWQPIETAPKDGTRVDLWAYRGECGAHGYREGERYTDCRFTRSTYGTEPFGDPRWQGLNDRYIKVTPTHWMPLPSPPALHSTQEG